MLLALAAAPSLIDFFVRSPRRSVAPGPHRHDASHRTLTYVQPNLRLLRVAPRRMPELLLASPARVFERAKLVTFSRQDRASLERLARTPGGMALDLGTFPGYHLEDDPLSDLRDDLDAYLAGERDRPPALDFDAIRS